MNLRKSGFLRQQWLLVAGVIMGLLYSPLLAAGPLIPADRMVDWHPGVEGGIPNVKTQITLRAEVLSKGDAGKLIQQAIEKIKPPGAVLLPEGTFNLKSRLLLKSGVVLRGRGPEATRLIFNSPNTIWFGAIRMSGSKSKRTVRVLGGSERGSRKITVESTEGLKKGQTILISRDNIPAVMYTKPQWKASWDARAVGQIFRITAIAGKTIELDAPLRLAYPKSLNPSFQILQPIEKAGIEDLYIKRLDNSEDDMVGINKALNCWIRNVESESCMKSHVLVFFSRFITIEGSYFHHAYNYSGGHGYGVDINKHSTDCLITNNIFHDLRHSMSVCLGANGNVFSYNYSFKNTLNDVCIHGHYSYMNLFEGNVIELVKYADWWGPTGPLTTCFRNRVATEIVLYDHSHKATIVGNTIRRKIDTDGTSKDTFAEGNLIGGKMVWQKAAAGSRIPASLYLKAKPAFWGNRPWPGIGADVDKGGMRTPLPAEDRYRKLRQ